MPVKSIPFGKACEKAGVKPGTVRMWRKRARDRASEGGGDQAVLRSEFFEPKDGRVDRDGLQFLCIFVQLTEMGLPIRDAAACALQYTSIDQQRPPREAGRPFETGKTVLVVARPVAGGAFEAKVLNLPSDRSQKTPDNVFFELVLFHSAPQVAALVVDLNAIEVRVDAAFADAGDRGEAA